MTWILPRLVGTGAALDLLWSSRKIDADEALRLGLVQQVVAPDELLDTARAYVADLAANVVAERARRHQAPRLRPRRAGAARRRCSRPTRRRGPRSAAPTPRRARCRCSSGGRPELRAPRRRVSAGVPASTDVTLRDEPDDRADASRRVGELEAQGPRRATASGSCGCGCSVSWRPPTELGWRTLAGAGGPPRRPTASRSRAEPRRRRARPGPPPRPRAAVAAAGSPPPTTLFTAAIDVGGSGWPRSEPGGLAGGGPGDGDDGVRVPAPRQVGCSTRVGYADGCGRCSSGRSPSVRAATPRRRPARVVPPGDRRRPAPARLTPTVALPTNWAATIVPPTPSRQRRPPARWQRNAPERGVRCDTCARRRAVRTGPLVGCRWRRRRSARTRPTASA